MAKKSSGSPKRTTQPKAQKKPAKLPKVKTKVRAGGSGDTIDSPPYTGFFHS
jgi:hypothetical protein